MKSIESVEIILDRPRVMLINMAALLRAEREINKQRREDGLEPVSIFELINHALRGVSDLKISAQFVSVMLWASLLHEDPALTYDHACSLIGEPIPSIGKVFAAINAYFSEPTPGQEVSVNASPLDRPNGLASGPLPGSLSD